jgi:hypothetical protein
MKKLLIVVALAFLFITGCTTFLHWGVRGDRERRPNDQQQERQNDRPNDRQDARSR